MSDEYVVTISDSDKVLVDIYHEGLSKWSLLKFGHIFNIDKYGYLRFFDESYLVGGIDGD